MNASLRCFYPNFIDSIRGIGSYFYGVGACSKACLALTCTKIKIISVKSTILYIHFSIVRDGKIYREKSEIWDKKLALTCAKDKLLQHCSRTPLSQHVTNRHPDEGRWIPLHRFVRISGYTHRGGAREMGNQVCLMPYLHAKQNLTQKKGERE